MYLETVANTGRQACSFFNAQFPRLLQLELSQSSVGIQKQHYSRKRLLWPDAITQFSSLNTITQQHLSMLWMPEFDCRSDPGFKSAIHTSKGCQLTQELHFVRGFYHTRWSFHFCFSDLGGMFTRLLRSLKLY